MLCRRSLRQVAKPLASSLMAPAADRSRDDHTRDRGSRK
jgi:hypothetical protein